MVHDDGALYGSVTLSDLADAAFDTSMDTLLKAADVARPHPPALERAADLDAALKLMENEGEEHVAVVEDTDGMMLVGVVYGVDVMLVYNRALMRARAEERGEL